MSEKGYENDVFFSYSGKNQPVVGPVVSKLKARGLRVWAYNYEIYESAIDAINGAMANSRDWVLWLSKDSLQSGYSKLEMNNCLHLFAGQEEDSERRLWLVLLDETAASEMQPLFKDFQKSRTLVGADLRNPPDDKLSEVAEWLRGVIRHDRDDLFGPDPSTVPVAVLAMTKAEALELAGGAGATDAAALEQVRQFLAQHRVELAAAYGEGRDDWRPLEWPSDDEGWPREDADAFVLADKKICDKVRTCFELVRDEMQARLAGGPRLECAFYSDELFSSDGSTRRQTQRAIRAGPAPGCIFVVDAVSLLYRPLLTAFTGALGFFDARNCAIVLLSPLQLEAQGLHRRLYLLLKSAGIDQFINRYHHDLDPRAEVAGAGLHGVSRWLRHTFPAMFAAWFQGQETPDEGNVRTLRLAPPVGRPPAPGQARQARAAGGRGGRPS